MAMHVNSGNFRYHLNLTPRHQDGEAQGEEMGDRRWEMGGDMNSPVTCQLPSAISHLPISNPHFFNCRFLTTFFEKVGF
jgi:hypothetical protein